MQPFMENIMLETVSGYGDEEILRKRAGLRVEIKQEGKLGAFSLTSLLGALGSVAGLFTLVALATDYAALFLYVFFFFLFQKIFVFSLTHSKQKNTQL
jgi:hypothetical protein